MSTKNKYLKYIVVALVVVFLVSAAFLLLELWEGGYGRFSESGVKDGVITYNGREYVYKDNLETFLVLGLDKYEGADSSESHESGIQTDFLMLFVFDNESKQSTAIQIDRDTMTRVNKLAVGGTSVVDSYTKQIALAYNYVNGENDKIRCRNTKDSVEYLLDGVKVNHYLSLTMDAVAVSCELVGGVEVTVLDDFTGIDDTLIKGEQVTLKGESALNYVRTRYGLEDSTNSTRMARQQQFINALYEKVRSKIDADEGFLVRFIDGIDEYVAYDSSDRQMQKLADKFDDYEFLGIRKIEGESKLNEQEGYVEFHADEEAVRKLVIELFYEAEADGAE